MPKPPWLVAFLVSTLGADLQPHYCSFFRSCEGRGFPGALSAMGHYCGGLVLQLLQWAQVKHKAPCACGNLKSPPGVL